MITALTALRTSLPAVVNQSQPPNIGHIGSQQPPCHPPPQYRLCSACGPQEQETHTVCNWLQFAAKPLPLFSSTYSLFFHVFTPDFLCFHQLPSSFLQNRGVGGSMTNFYQRKTKPLKGREPRTAWGEAIQGLGVTARTGP